MEITGSYMEMLRAFENVRRLLDPKLALSDGHLNRIELKGKNNWPKAAAAALHLEYQVVRNEIDADELQELPDQSVDSPFIAAWDGHTSDLLVFYATRDRQTTLKISATGDRGVVLDVRRERPFDPRIEAHRRACAMLFTTVTEFNQVEATHYTQPQFSASPGRVSVGAPSGFTVS